ncbi:hypothetical protein QJQ45_027777 [Haematococcus lacustris]|nr:hypothetical protein QJQ45_027777 [Haematococcus lacustris]
MSLGSMGGLRPGVVGPMANPALHGAHMGLAGPPKLMGGGNSLMQHNKMGSGVADETSKQWKLFVGQVPFEASEADLWGVFSTIGPILELVVLRTPQGKSKGCAFVTYENRQLAEKAVHQLDGQVCLPDDPKQRVLIVKFASSPSQSSSQLGTPGRPQAPQGSTGSTSESPGPGQCQGQMGQGQVGQGQGQHPSPGGLSGVQGRFEGGASTAAVRKLLTHPGNQQQQMQQHMQQQMQQQMQQHVQQQMQQQGMGMGMAMHLPVPNGGMQNHIGAVGMGAHSMQGMQGY